jgi:hypothetical protein
MQSLHCKCNAVYQQPYEVKLAPKALLKACFGIAACNELAVTVCTA